MNEVDDNLLNRIGRIICDLVGGDTERTVMIQKICNEVKLNESRVNEILRQGKEIGLLESPTSNQVKLTPLGACQFCK